MEVSAIASSTASLSASESIPSRPVYGYRPDSTTSRQVMSSGETRSVSSIESFLASSFAPVSRRLFPLMNTVPASGSSCFAAVRSNVDFPQPLGPISVVILPRSAVISAPLSTTFLP